MEIFRHDLKFAVRSLFRQPAFALITILTLALGIGANTAIFSVVNGVLLRPLDYPQSNKLVYVTSQFPTLGFDQFWVSMPEFVEFRDNNQSFSSIGAYSVGAANLGTDPPSRPVRALVTPELMTTLGVQPVLGRVFNAADAAPKAPPVVILSWDIWQRGYGGDATIVGKPILINGTPTEVVGVMPAAYDVHDQKIELWQPLTIDPSTFANSRSSHFLYMVGRLKDGLTIDQAKADTTRLVNQWRTMVPQGHVPSAPRHQIRLDPLKDDIIGSIQRPLLILQGAVVFVLLIACANLANLLLARAETRHREFAVRSALGAARIRLLRQFVTEGLLLALIASAVGTGLAWAGVKAMISVNPDAIPRTASISLDGSVLVFTLVTAIVTGVIFGLAPLLHLSDKLSIALRDGSRGTTASGLRKALRGTLVVSQVTLAVVLVVGAALLVRSFINLTKVDTGFNRAKLVTFGLVLPASSYPPPRRVAFFNDLESKLGAIPGVQSVSAMTGLPPNRPVNANDTDFEHITPPPPGTDPTTVNQPPENVDYYQTVSLNYIETMGIPVVKGRAFEPADVGGAPVVMVNEALARRFFTDRDPIGGHLKPGGAALPWFTIIGVVKDVKQGGVDQDAGTELYTLADQQPRIAGFAPANMNIVMRSALPLEAIAPQIRASVRGLDASLPIVKLQTMDDVFGTAVARPRFLTVLLGVFAVLALVLAAVGTYGILSYLVTQRQQEIGIRMALGAARGGVLWLVMRQGLVLAAIGLTLGVTGSILVGRYLQTLLFEISPSDPATLIMVGGVILVTATVACLIPALRATRVNPLDVLRGE